MSCNNCGSEPLPRFLTVKGVAKELGMTTKAVYAHISRGTLPGVNRLGSIIRVNTRVLLAKLAVNGRNGALVRKVSDD